jgi:hypothetical protein
MDYATKTLVEAARGEQDNADDIKGEEKQEVMNLVSADELQVDESSDEGQEQEESDEGEKKLKDTIGALDLQDDDDFDSAREVGPHICRCSIDMVNGKDIECGESFDKWTELLEHRENEHV